MQNKQRNKTRRNPINIRKIAATVNNTNNEQIHSLEQTLRKKIYERNDGTR